VSSWIQLSESQQERFDTVLQVFDLHSLAPHSRTIALQRTTDPVGDHQARAIRLRIRDVDRTPRSLAASRPLTFQPQPGGKEMINELDRLMTITDLAEMLGVPVDTLYWWRHRGEGPAGYGIGRHVRYRRAAVEAWLDTQADKRQR
jgi:excisionase family DNA binding protein